jgi:predicted porin
VSFTCDRAVAGVVGGGVPPNVSFRRRNEVQLAARWRGSFGGVGIAVSGGGIFADPTKNIAPGPLGAASGEQVRVGYVGAQVSAYGFLVGGHYVWGAINAGGAPLASSNAALGIVDDSDLSQFFLGASYTFGAVTVGANWYWAESAGNQFLSDKREETAFSIGATYRLAPGLELVAEYNNWSREEDGFNFVAGAPNATGPGFGVNNKLDGQLYLLGARLAF